MQQSIFVPPSARDGETSTVSFNGVPPAVFLPVCVCVFDSNGVRARTITSHGFTSYASQSSSHLGGGFLYRPDGLGGDAGHPVRRYWDGHGGPAKTCHTCRDQRQAGRVRACRRDRGRVALLEVAKKAVLAAIREALNGRQPASPIL